MRIKIKIIFFHGKLDEHKNTQKQKKPNREEEKKNIKKLDLISIVSVFTAFFLLQMK